MCIDHGITTAKELIGYDGTNTKMLPQWRDKVQNYYDKIEWQMATVLSKIERLEQEPEWAGIDDAIAFEAIHEVITHLDANQEKEKTSKEELPPSFSNISDTSITIAASFQRQLWTASSAATSKSDSRFN